VGRTLPALFDVSDGGVQFPTQSPMKIADEYNRGWTDFTVAFRLDQRPQKSLELRVRRIDCDLVLRQHIETTPLL